VELPQALDKRQRALQMPGNPDPLWVPAAPRSLVPFPPACSGFAELCWVLGAGEAPGSPASLWSSLGPGVAGAKKVIFLVWNFFVWVFCFGVFLGGFFW